MSPIRGRIFSLPSHPQVGEVGGGCDLIATLFADDEQVICAYFEKNYIGRLAFWGRERPMFGLELRTIRNITEAGAFRANNSPGRTETDFARMYRTETASGQRRDSAPEENAPDQDLSDVELGAVKPDGETQALRNQIPWGTVSMYLGDSDAARLLRGVDRNYL